MILKNLYIPTMKQILAVISLMVFIGCGDAPSTDLSKSNADSMKTVKPDSEDKHSKGSIIAKPVKYEILREPNGGSGVFDFMYIVYVNGSITNDQAQWLFDDIIRQKGGGKIAIDVWSNKKAFYEVLKIYQKEDQVFDAGGNMKEFAKERDKVTAKYDRYNIAQYSNNGVDISTKYPEDN